MLRLALKSVKHKPARLTLTVAAIALGVSFIAGSYIFTNSIKSAFDGLLGEIYAGTDVTVIPTDTVNSQTAPSDDVEGFPRSVLEDVQAVDGVAVAEGGVNGLTQLFTEDGEPVGTQGPPTIVTHAAQNPDFNVVEVIEGQLASTSSEIAIDISTADRVGLAIGDSVYIQQDDGRDGYRITGLVSFGEQNTLLGATLALFTLDEATAILELDGEFTALTVSAEAGVEADELRDRIQDVLPSGLSALTADDQQANEAAEVGEGLDFINTFLLVFAYISVFVGAFIIYNTFRIIVAQRNKELGLLRAIGARPAQVVRSILVEALVIAIIASIVGMGLGFGVAALIESLFEGFGGDIPVGDRSLTFEAVASSLLTGIIITLLSALLPAIHASRVSPMEALRESAGSARKPLRGLTIAGVIVFGVGALTIAGGLLAPLPSPASFVGFGALFVFVGVFLMSAQLAVPVSRWLTKPLTAIGGASGKLAASNLRREARRTASTSAALMVGVSIVTLVATFAASVNDTLDDFLRDSFPADFIVQPKGAGFNPFATIPSGVAPALGDLDVVSLASQYSVLVVDVEGSEEFIGVMEAETVEQGIDLHATPDFSTVGDGVFVLDSYIGDKYEMGQVITIDGPSGRQDVEIVGTVSDAANGNYLVDYSVGQLLDEDLSASGVLLRLELDTTIDESRVLIDEVLVDFPTAEALSLGDLADVFRGFLNTFVNLLTGLLGLALFIAVVGIANTLLLSVTERTHEIGLLRAVGLDRRSTGLMIGWESIVTALFGAVIGMVLGVVLAWAIIVSLRDSGFTGFAVPWVNIGLYTGFAVFAGIVAAIWPAMKAARLNILEAIATE